MRESSFINKIQWFDGMLYVTLKTEQIYEYADVPEDIYLKFLESDSWGKFFTTKIKPEFEGTPVDSDVLARWPLPKISPTPDDKTEGKYIDWTQEEEEAFLNILNSDSDNSLT